MCIFIRHEQHSSDVRRALPERRNTTWLNWYTLFLQQVRAKSSDSAPRFRKSRLPKQPPCGSKHKIPSKCMHAQKEEICFQLHKSGMCVRLTGKREKSRVEWSKESSWYPGNNKRMMSVFVCDGSIWGCCNTAASCPLYCFLPHHLKVAIYGAFEDNVNLSIPPPPFPAQLSVFVPDFIFAYLANEKGCAALSLSNCHHFPKCSVKLATFSKGTLFFKNMEDTSYEPCCPYQM